MPDSHLRLRALIVSAMMAALAITLPIGFHAAGLGSTFSPLLLPLLLNGFLAPAGWAVLTGAVAPLLSGAMTGMPPFYPPIAFIMSAEGMVLAGVAAALYRRTRPRVWVPLVCAVVLGRLTNLALTWQLAGMVGLPKTFSAVASLVHSLPGTALQCTVVPAVVRALNARRSLLLGGEEDGQASVL